LREFLRFFIAAEDLKLATPIFEINSLSHVYAGQTVLSIEQLKIKPASIVGLIGPNGSGKSTLLRLLGHIEKPTSGEIFYDGKPVEPFSDEARFQITMLPQEPFLLKRSVLDNVCYGLKLRGNGPDKAVQANEALSLLGLDSDDFARRPWYALSGGETQRVALAARLALKPRVLLLDEPTASVDAASAQLIKEASFRARQEMGTTLLVASHDWQWLYEICDEILRLFRGRIYGEDSDTIIFGPWRELEAGYWGKRLPDQQQLRVPPPPRTDAAAVIGALSAFEDPSEINAEDIALRGIVSRLSLERNSGQVFATIIAGNLPFNVGLTPQQRETQAIYPGKTIFIRYGLDQIKWI
jgi:tungstate transport system ATP-binding protein